MWQWCWIQLSRTTILGISMAAPGVPQLVSGRICPNTIYSDPYIIIGPFRYQWNNPVGVPTNNIGYHTMSSVYSINFLIQCCFLHWECRTSIQVRFSLSVWAEKNLQSCGKITIPIGDQYNEQDKMFNKPNDIYFSLNVLAMTITFHKID